MSRDGRIVLNIGDRYETVIVYVALPACALVLSAGG